VILAALPGMVKVLLESGKLAKPGNSCMTVNPFGSQLQFFGLGNWDEKPDRRFHGIRASGRKIRPEGEYKDQGGDLVLPRPRLPTFDPLAPI
jgi:hypothetical protein